MAGEYGKRLSVPDTSANMTATAVRLETSESAIRRYVSFKPIGNTTVYMWPSATTATAADVVANGWPLDESQLSLQPSHQDEALDLSRYWFATASGAGEVVAIG